MVAKRTRDGRYTAWKAHRRGMGASARNPGSAHCGRATARSPIAAAFGSPDRPDPAIRDAAVLNRPILA